MTAAAATPRCLNCERDQTASPLMVWRYPGKDLWVCPECLPALIHHRQEFLDKARPPAAEGAQIEVTGD